MTWVKFCGTTNVHDAQLSIAAGADALGFIFAPSPRRVDIAQAAEIVRALHNEVEAIGVFVNEDPARVAAIADEVGLSGVQLHGDEPAEKLPDFRQALGSRKIVKALSARELQQSADGLVGYLEQRDSIDAILLDSGSAAKRGGTGVTFAWQEATPIAAQIQAVMPLIIAGGLSAQNVGEAIELFRPWGVDVVSGVESAPGSKDETKLREFSAAVRRVQGSVTRK
jgi:phosphoribosylanthranilate isomerase